jgi:hypothetical protein
MCAFHEENRNQAGRKMRDEKQKTKNKKQRNKKQETRNQKTRSSKNLTETKPEGTGTEGNDQAAGSWASRKSKEGSTKEREVSVPWIRSARPSLRAGKRRREIYPK